MEVRKKLLQPPFRLTVLAGDEWRLLTPIAINAAGTHACVSTSFHMSKQALCESVHLTTSAILKALPRGPQLRDFTETELDETAKQFSRQHHFRGIIGAIDVTNIHIFCPFSGLEGRSYFNKHKNAYTIKLQGTVDANGLFIDWDVGAPGAMHDSTVLAMSGLATELRMHQSCAKGRHYLIADGVYPLRAWIIKPFSGTAVENDQTCKQFNTELSSKCTTS